MIGRASAVAPSPLLALLLALASSPAAAAPKIAVTEVKPLQGVSEASAAVVTELVTTEIARQKRFEVIARSDIAAILGLAREKALTGCAEDTGCMARIGGALGVDYLLVGQVSSFGTRYRLSLVLTDVRKVKVAAREGRFCEASEDALATMAQDSVRSLLEAAFGAAPPPSAPATPPTSPAPTPTVAAPAPAAPAAQPPVPSVPAASAAAAPAAAQEGPGRSHTWSFVAGGAGLAILAGAGLCDALAWSSYQSERDAAKVGDAASFNSNKSDSLTRGRVADVMYGAGAAGLAAGVILFFVAPRESARVHVGAVPLRGGSALTVSVEAP